MTRQENDHPDHRRHDRSPSPAGTTIMEAAETAGHPHPAALLPSRPEPGRLVPRVHRRREGHGLLHGLVQSARSGKGWRSQTNSPEIRQARRDIVELLLDNHPMDCQTCERDGNCELQNLAYSMGVRARHFEGRAQATSRSRTPATRSSATPRSASSAAAASGSAPRSRASTT